jgi:hypothetical protein
MQVQVWLGRRAFWLRNSCISTVGTVAAHGAACGVLAIAATKFHLRNGMRCVVDTPRWCGAHNLFV